MAQNPWADALHVVHFLVTLVTEVWRRQRGAAGAGDVAGARRAGR